MSIADGLILHEVLEKFFDELAEKVGSQIYILKEELVGQLDDVKAAVAEAAAAQQTALDELQGDVQQVIDLVTNLTVSQAEKDEIIASLNAIRDSAATAGTALDAVIGELPTEPEPSPVDGGEFPPIVDGGETPLEPTP